jgi:protein SCO1/2
LNALNKILTAFLLLAAIAVFPLRAEDEPKSPIGVDEKLGEKIPLDLTFMDEYGKPVILRSLFTKPTLLTLVYYRCPGICSPLLSGVSDVVDKMDMEPGRAVIDSSP